jgi:hypothetical protein
MLQNARTGRPWPAALAITDLGQPVPGLPVAEIVQARGSNRSRETLSGTAQRVPDLAQKPRPVPVVFRCHSASVP